MLDKNIFRAYDVRGVVNKNLTPDLMARIGMAFGTYLKGRGRVCLGRDVRTTSEMMKDAFLSGLLSTGVDVVDIGLVPIPVENFMTGSGEFDAGAYITASHNPPEYNGVRLRRSDGSGYTEENEDVWEIVAEEKYLLASWDGVGSVSRIEDTEAVDKYKDFILERIKIGRPIKAVLDIGNGSAFNTAPLLMKDAGVETYTINELPDGTFPNRPSEPNDKTLGELKKEVVNKNGDFGVGYDGDSDRSMFVDDKGRTVSTEKIGIILARDIVHRRGPGAVVANVSCSMILEEELEKLNVEVKRVRVGDVFIAEAIKKFDAILALETSAHIFLPEFYIFDDPILATLQVARILSESDERLSDLVDALPRYPYEEIKFASPDEVKFRVMEEIIESFKERGQGPDLTDGAKVTFEDGWILLRPSNTSPIIRAAIEARSPERLEELKSIAQDEFEKASKKIGL